MIISLRLVNFKCFRDLTIPFRSENVLIGRNNAGKSTIVEALRLVALILGRYEHLRFVDPPHWTELHPKARGVSPSLDDLDLNFESLFHRYGEPPARIVATFENETRVEVLLGRNEERGLVHGVLRDRRNKAATNAGEAKALRLPSLSILPQVAPLNKTETILNQAYVQRSLATSLAPQHFRNQINILYQYYPQFRKIAEDSWPGLRVIEFKGRGGESSDPLALLVQSDDFVAEVSWMGHGLQMWLQTMWFLARSKSADIVMLDEPDVYMHPDLQRRLIKFLQKRFPQTIITTHSVEILSEVAPQKILLVDKRRQHAGFADTMSALQLAVDRLGATQNLQLSRLWSSRKLLLVEGKDIDILKYFYALVFPESLDSLASTPNFPIGGWGGWNYAVGSAMLLENSVGEQIKTYCILDSDYHTPEEISKRLSDAQAKAVYLHIWKRKEIESYLLVPSLISRVISKGGSSHPSVDEVSAKISQMAIGLKDEILDCFAESFLVQNRAQGAANANQAARRLVNAAWQTEQGVIERLPGKKMISNLSSWSKETFDVSFGVTTLLQEMKRSELDGEVVSILTAIEEQIAFSPQ